MKKTLSLILAALMCAAMTPAVFAEEVVEEATAVVDVAEDAGIMLISEEEGQIVADEITVEEPAEELAKDVDAAVIALAATFEITLTPEMVADFHAIEGEITAEAIVAVAALYEVELAPEFVEALLAILVDTVEEAELPADVIGGAVAETEIVVVEEVVEVAEEEAAIVEEVVEEEPVSKFPVILKDTPMFGLFTKILSIFTFRG